MIRCICQVFLLLTCHCFRDVTHDPGKGSPTFPPSNGFSVLTACRTLGLQDLVCPSPPCLYCLEQCAVLFTKAHQACLLNEFQGHLLVHCHGFQLWPGISEIQTREGYKPLPESQAWSAFTQTCRPLKEPRSNAAVDLSLPIGPAIVCAPKFAFCPSSLKSVCKYSERGR